MADAFFIRARQRPGMRRAGVYIPFEGLTLDPSDFDSQQLALLETEAGLLISEDLPEELSDEPDEFLDDIVEVMGMLNGDKKPSVRAVEKLLGHNISGAQRDRAWAVYQTRLANA
ncbi:hypothetical protein CS022_22460 [Veronia nyctiphanis]|uniref:Uncharacterized protein n=1 Tax=Veronia nyctiphanis TaxID=1278244 RepID=A0A4V1LS82_9GAMM|nr:hypothetical protein [Veronia nyctiphanis]RXJ70788.1 hypothetical protein CS022_22460 [Veronia nyctiphanis]